MKPKMRICFNNVQPAIFYSVKVDGDLQCWSPKKSKLNLSYSFFLVISVPVDNIEYFCGNYKAWQC